MNSPVQKLPVSWLTLATAVGYAACLIIALGYGGALGSGGAYLVFLLLLLPGFVCVVTGGNWFGRLRYLPLIVTGAILLFHVASRPTLWGRGYVLASIGWLALWVTTWLVRRNPDLVRLMAVLLIAFGGLGAVLDGVRAMGGGSDVATTSWGGHDHHGVQLSIVLALASGLAWVVLRRKSSGRGAGSYAITRTMILALLLAVLSLGLSTGMDRIAIPGEQLNGEHPPAATGGTLELIRDHPIAGVGPGMYDWRIPAYRTVRPGGPFASTGNDYLRIAAEWGIPLATVFWIFVAYCCLRAIRCAAQNADHWNRGVALGCAAAILSVVLQSFVDHGLHAPSSLVLFCTILGLTSGLNGTVERSGQDYFYLARAALCVLLLASGWTVFRQTIALRISETGGSIEQEMEALAWDAGCAEYYFSIGRRYLEGSEILDPSLVRPLLEQAVRLNPFEPDYRQALGRFCEMVGEAGRAEEEYLTAVSLRPASPECRWTLANFYGRAGDLDAALPQFRAALSADRTLLPVGLATLVRLGASATQIEQSWPTDQEALSTLLELRREQGETDSGDVHQR